MKYKTPIQELIKKLSDFKVELDIKYDGDPLVKRGIVIAISEANQLLEKEKQSILDAWNDGYTTYDTQERFELNQNLESAENYFESKYGK